ncbi:Ferredoxin subunit of nitrite reductase or a ring-hydroxylating dioxygenase [Micromonospora phaseoli]|uniref:Cytochrome bc1 complex Rieske iron-sulfur subunit n=1 Tax=Micromonospora phaseoli TaxID=1144548 RepID=A0A1H6YF14_9ACTN|nr:Rieske (2Fe-2S) protein [Micromonospora phaseoli]PZW00136.1 nitrite reductase/ring-hydroxylating ferredoxin subunit [Micromonospora phaseoli]GIJ78843.1 iron-sulfur protein [Micromonospora phaseoli]SEJ39056.1 Ferredoxin subunit of nitrite reductase or a ring-hydroxylating dioxygenase [Micromonospora phaseoli]
MNHEQAGCCRSRRALLAGTGAVGVAALTGCATYGQPQPAAPPPPAAAPGSSTDPSGTATPGADGEPGPPALATLADIPVGGGAIFADAGVVLTQPTEGTIKAYSATCTHQGCTVTSVADGTIVCACHNSVFDIADGSVRSGPAGAPLPAANVTVDGDAIRLA